MKELSELLKAKRESKGLTIQQVSDKTRLPVNRIKAIEDGDIESFKNDLSYLHFFLQSYCNAIDYDYSEVKQLLQDTMDSYTTSFYKKEVEEHEQMERNILEKSKAKEKKVIRRTNTHRKYEKRQIDFSLITFIGVVAIVILSVVFVGGYYLTRPSSPDPLPPVVDQPTDDKPNPGDVPEEVIPELAVIKKDATHYVIENAKETVKISVEFKNSSWIMGKIDGIQTKKPVVNKIYTPGEVIEFEMDPLTQKQCSLRFGYFVGTKLSVNGKEIEIDDTIKNTNVTEIYFEIGGTSNESTK